jgi:flagellar protein FlbD
MIRLTRLNDEPLVLNSDLIKFIEAAPDTVITLITGEKVVVLEETEQVLKLIVEFRRGLLAGLTYAGVLVNLPEVLWPKQEFEETP